jgi:hypothetical protein
VLGIQHDDAELLDGGGAVLRQQVGRQLLRRLVMRAFEGASHERAPA